MDTEKMIRNGTIVEFLSLTDILCESFYSFGQLEKSNSNFSTLKQLRCRRHELKGFTLVG